MRSDDKLSDTIKQVATSRLSRRRFIGRAVVFGISTPIVTSLLAACGDEEEEDGEEGAAQPTATTAPAAGEQPTATTAPAGAGEASPTVAAAGQTPQAAGEGQRGGTLKIALIGEPPALDIHQTTATIVSLTTWHMYETLFTWDADLKIIPLLADTYEVSEDGLTNTVALRQGVPFHNGEEMKAVDVIASIERWGQISGLGKNLVEQIDTLEATDEYTVTATTAEPVGTFSVILARQNQGCAIYPKSLIDSVGAERIEDGFTGTGPYQFVERQADRFIRMQRFEDYAQPPGEPNGYGGRKNAYVDEIEFIPVPDEAARLAGLQAGDYHYLESVSTDQFVALQGDPSVSVELSPATGWEIYVVNTKSELMQDIKIRQAIQAALDPEPMLLAGQGEDFYRLDPSIMLQETAFHSTAGQDKYNIGDPALAKQYLDEAGYDGTPLRLLTTQEYQDMFNQAVVAQQQLEAAGFTIEPLVHDWATLVERRSDQGYYDVFTTGIAFRVDPVTLPFLQGNTWPGWWDTEEKQALVKQLQQESDFEKRYAIFEQIQQLFYDEIPAVKIGDSFSVIALSPNVKGFNNLIQLAPEFVNVWLEE